MKKNDLHKIIPKWACSENVDMLLDYSQHPDPDIGNHKVFRVDVKNLITKLALYGFDLEKLLNGDESSDQRISSTLNRWEKGEFVDPPTINIDENDDRKLMISDGRHRFKLAYHMNEKQIPIAIPICSIEKINKIIKLTEC